MAIVVRNFIGCPPLFTIGFNASLDLLLMRIFGAGLEAPAEARARPVRQLG
jgi:hypothetical protein